MPNPSFPVLLQQFFTHLRGTQEVSIHTITAYRDTLKLLLHFIAKERRLTIERITFEAFIPETILAFPGISTEGAPQYYPHPQCPAGRLFAPSFVFPCTRPRLTSSAKLNESSPFRANAPINLCSASSVARRSRPSSRPQIWRLGLDDATICSFPFSTIQDFTNYYVPLSSAVTATNLTDARKQGGVLAYGDFITVVINFLIVAIALFVAIKAINTLTRRAAKEPPVPAPPTQEVVLLTQIRDELAKRGA